MFVEILHWTESSSYRSKEEHNLSKAEVERGSFPDQLESSKANKNSKPGYQTRYFIIKSLNYENIQLSVERGIWATQVMNEPILEGAFHVRTSRFLSLQSYLYSLVSGKTDFIFFM